MAKETTLALTNSVHNCPPNREKTLHLLASAVMIVQLLEIFVAAPQWHEDLDLATCTTGRDNFSARLPEMLQPVSDHAQVMSTCPDAFS